MVDTSMRLTWPRWPSSASSNNGDESPGDELGATSPMSCGGDGAATAGGPDEVVERRSDGSDAPIISTFDRILAINGEKPRTARDAAAMIRDAQGCVRIRLLRKPPVFVADSALKLQRRWRQRRGSRIEIVWKAAAAAAVGVAFSDALEDAAGVASVVPNSLASDAALRPGDRLVAVDAKHVGSPGEAAEMLRQARGAVALTVVEAARVDQDALLASERRRRAAEADGTAEPCALCLEVPRSELVALTMQNNNDDDDDCRITFRSTQAERDAPGSANVIDCTQNEQMQVEEMPKMHTFMATMKEKRWALTTALMTALSWAVWTGWRWAIRQHKLISPPLPPQSPQRRASLDIFISLRLDEAKEHARALKTAIESVRPGVECFVSGDNAYGARIDQIISEAVVSCRLAVVMGTKTYGLPTASTFSTDQELQFILETPKPFFLVKMCDCFEVSTTQLKLGPRCGSIKYMEWLPGAPMPERLVAEILSTLDSCAEAGPASSNSAPLPSQLNVPRLLAVGCNIGLPAVDTELRAIEAALPSGWVVVERNPTAEKAASKTPALPCFHFCGHADPKLGSHRTLLWVKNGRPEAIDAPSLVQMLRRAELVVLNGCKSLALAEALAHAGVPNVVSWETLAHDDASSRFGVAFWKRVAEATQAGAPLRDAARLGFEAGELAVRSETTVGSLANGALPAFTPRFALGIDPQDAALVKQAAPGRGRCLPAAGPDAEGRIAAGRPVLLQPQRPRGDLPAIPDHYALRLADAALRERLVKDGLQPISLVGGSRGGGGAAALAGTAGLGKSTLAAVVALDVRVQSTFHDGIFWLRFGQERRALDVLRELAGMIDVDISALREQQTAIVDAIARWLDTRRCLLILDDVWTLEQAKPFTRLHAGRLLTTRVREVATRAGGRTQEMETLDPREALRLLAACKQTDADLSTDADAKELVRLSGGLPVVLEQWGAVCRDQSMRSFLEELRRARGHNTFVEVEGGGDYEYDTFFAGMEVQLSRLEVNARIARCCCRLAVLPEDTEMPLSVAAMLWGVDDVDAAAIARKLEGQNLVKRTEAGGRTEASLSLLDLHLQYLRHRGRNAIAGWHAALLRGWMEGSGGGMLRPAGYWKGAGVLKHHLCGAGSVILPESLTDLNINGSYVGNEGAKALASALEGNGVLKNIDLRYNSLGDEGRGVIRDAVSGREGFKLEI